jgi:hypothetical protein
MIDCELEGSYLNNYTVMKYIFALLLLLPLIHTQSSNASPNALNKDVVVSAVKPDFKATEYFSLA